MASIRCALILGLVLVIIRGRRSPFAKNRHNKSESAQIPIRRSVLSSGFDQTIAGIQAYRDYVGNIDVQCDREEALC